MRKIPYVNYNDLAEFYTIQQLAELLGLTKQELKEKCEQHGIRPRQNEVGEYGFVRFDVRKLHYALYHESRAHNSKGDSAYHKEEDPWA